MKIIPHLGKKLSFSRRLTWGSLIVFMLILLINGLVSSQPFSLIIITFIPIALILPGLYKERYKTISLLCFVTLLYFMIAVTNVFSRSANQLDIAELVLLVVLFNAAMMFSRWKQYSLYQDL